jgi:hypothetical protein
MILARPVLSMLVLTISPGELPSGPSVGEPIPGLRVRVADGPGVGETLDLTVERGGRPTIYAFVQAAQLDRPLARLLRVIDTALADETGDDGPRLVAVWLTDTPEASLEFLPRAQQSLKLTRTTWTVFEGARQGPAGWSINDSVGVTFVVARDGKVVRSVGLDSWSDSDARPTLAALRAGASRP